MLGDFGRAEDIVQDAWLRWQGRGVEVDAPKAYLIQVVTHLCLNDLGSAQARKEEARGDRLPEPVDLNSVALGRIEMIDQISMAFLVVLQRLTPAERAVLLLHDVFDFSHNEIATILEKTEDASRQLLRRAKEHVSEERRVLSVTKQEHQRLLEAFLTAAAGGHLEDLVGMLASDAVLIIDAGPEGGRFGRVRSLPGPLSGAHKVAAFVAAVTPQGSAELSIHFRELNGQPAAVVLREGQPYTAIMIAVAEGTPGAVPYTFLVASLIVLIFGPGKFALDAWLAGRNGLARNRGRNAASFDVAVSPSSGASAKC